MAGSTAVGVLEFFATPESLTVDAELLELLFGNAAPSSGALSGASAPRKPGSGL